MLIGLLFTSCENQETDGTAHYTGALKTLMSGDLRATASLDSLSRMRNSYALGAIENLKGEVQIFNAEPFNSQVVNSQVVIDNSFKAKASLLVWAQVDAWVELSIPSEVKDISQLEQFIMKHAKAQGLDVEKPFPFLLEGKAMSLNWHVIDWIDGDTIHTHEKHKTSGSNGVLKNQKVEVLGFYSEKHKGVFTHHSTLMHMHFKTDNGDLAGHVDDLELAHSMILKLPKK